MNKNLVFSILAVFLVTALFLFWPKGNNNSQPDSQDIVLYYGDTCPHCKDVQKFIEENKVKEKIEIEEKEVYRNRQNSGELALRAQSCGLKANSVPVPFLSAEGKCYIGTDEVVGYLSDKAGLELKTQPSSSSGETN